LACPEELSLGEPRWRVIDTYPVMERLGWPYDLLWSWFRLSTGVRPYGIAHLRLLDGIVMSGWRPFGNVIVDDV
jgi:hypothetical protein